MDKPFWPEMLYKFDYSINLLIKRILLLFHVDVNNCVQSWNNKDTQLVKLKQLPIIDNKKQKLCSHII